ncbi:MAG: hypothetical protein ACOZAO_03855 [Patescibacteria group bacterium]
MALTETEKQKILEEEQFRAQIRNSSVQNSNTSPVKKKKGSFLETIIKGFMLLLIIGALSGFVTMLFVDPSSLPAETPQTAPTPKPTKRQTQSELLHNDAQVKLTNLNNFAWENCYMSLNNAYYFPSYPKFAQPQEVFGVEIGETLTLGYAKFVDKDSNRFNPFSMKPQTLTMFCDNQTTAIWGL